MDAVLADDDWCDTERTVVIAVRAVETDLALVRQRTRELLAGYPDPTVVDAVLVANAMASNAYDHGAAPHILRLTLKAGGGCLRVEADDSSVNSRPVVRGWSGSSGLGMLIVSHVAASWGVRQHRSHKTVWAEIELTA